MKIQFKQFNSIFENLAAPHVVMTLQSIIKNGKITDTVQSVIISQLLDALKSSSNPSVVRDILEYSSSSSAQIKSLPSEDQIHVAQQLLSIIQSGYQIGSRCPDPSSSSEAWINRVLQHQK